MDTLPPNPSSTSQLLASLQETMLGVKHLFGPVRSSEATILQVQVLGALRMRPGLSPTQLARRLYLSSSATAQLLQRLGDAGWIRREAGSSDLRVVSLFLTEEGTAVLARYGQMQDRERIKAVFAGLSEADKEQLASLLEKLNVALRKDVTNEKE
jgi:DNA-binding MarR family transcriptional regulator